MSRLVSVCRGNQSQPPTLRRRHHLLLVSDALAMIMDLGNGGLLCDNPQVKSGELGEFVHKYQTLNPDELSDAFRVTCEDLLSILNQTVPCVGCRRSVERLYYQLSESGHPTLDPVIVTPEGAISLSESVLSSPKELCSLLHAHGSKLQLLVENQPRSKKSQRCVLHSLESSRSRFIGDHAWRDVWECMSEQCREEVTFVKFQTLQETLDNYLRKHRFCGECRTKVVRAYQLLVEEKEPEKVKGYASSLYAGIRRCLLDKHLHLEAKTDYIESLIDRAKPEFSGSDRERHAKTLEIAQEEVLTCLGICIYERLHRISLRLKEEEGTCRVFAAVAIDALCRKFETAVERKCGVSKLELLYEEIAKEEAAKQQRKEQKKLRKRKKKACRPEEIKCGDLPEEETDAKDACQCEEWCHGGSINGDPCETLDEIYGQVGPCNSCEKVQKSAAGKSKRSSKTRHRNGDRSPSDHSRDSCYSENNNGCCDTISGSSSPPSSPEGSDVACSEGFCNHCAGDCTIENDAEKNAARDSKIIKTVDSGFTLSLQEMLLDNSIEEDCNDESYIPMEEILEFKARRNITEEREQLRQILRYKFAKLCAPQNIA